MNFIESLDVSYKNIRAGRLILLTVMAVMGLIGYRVVGFLVAQKGYDEGFHTPALKIFIDDYIPLVPEFTWVYFLFYVGLVIPVILSIPFRLCVRYMVAYLLSFWGALLIFYFAPTAIKHEAVMCTTLSCDALRFLRSVDASNNLVPSLHAALSLLAFLTVFLGRKKFKAVPVWMLVAPLYIGVVASTVLTKQHYFIDIPAGLLWAAMWWVVAGRITDSWTWKDE